MKKLQLNLDALQVESFKTQPRPDGGGTVRGHSGVPGCHQPTDSCDSDTTWPTATPWSGDCSMRTCSFCEEQPH